MHKATCIVLLTLFLWISCLAHVGADRETEAIVLAPVAGASVGGVVSIIGTFSGYAVPVAYQVAFAAATSPTHWIPIHQATTGDTLAGRLAFWDTTQIPDGVYDLRLRVVTNGVGPGYTDVYVRSVMVANAPRTRTPGPTIEPSPTPTLTPPATATITPWPTLLLNDGSSPMLYLTMVSESDPLCDGEQQRFGMWVSNIGAVTVTHVILTDIIPDDAAPILSQSSPGAYMVGDEEVAWDLGLLAPGQAVKRELQLELASWAELGRMYENKAQVSSDQLPYLARSVAFLYTECPWLKETEAARPFVMPTRQPTEPASRTPTPGGRPKPTLRPTVTPIEFTIDEDSVSRTLDVLTIVIAVSLGILLAVAAALVYGRLRRERR